MHCDRSSKRNLAMNIAMREMKLNGMSLPEARQLVNDLMKLTLPEIKDEIRRRASGVFQRRPHAPKRNPEGANIDTVESIREELERIARAIDEGDRVMAREIVDDAIDMLDDLSEELQKE